MKAVLALLTQATASEKLVTPELWLKATGELLFITIVVCGIITLAARPEFLEDNPVRTVLGYNNPCVMWDTPPALYVSTVVFSFIVYMTIRYVTTDSQRAALSGVSARTRRVVYACNTLYALSIATLMLIFVIDPREDVVAHSVVFLQLVPCRCVAVAGNYLEAPRVK